MRLGKTPVCKRARGCSLKPLLQVPRPHAIICVLHMLMRIGALLGEYLERLCLSPSREAQNAISNMLKIALCGWQPGGTCRPDGQETKRLIFILDGIAHVLGLADEHLGNQAVMRLRDVMQRLSRTYQRIYIDLGISRTLFARNPFSLSDNLGVRCAQNTRGDSTLWAWDVLPGLG